MTQAVVDQAGFAVTYDGEALRDHRMDVRDLAPALLGMAEVFQEAHAALNPGERPVSLEIRATDQGSFVVELTLVADHVENLLVSKPALAAVSLITFVMGGAGVFSFATKRRRARRETRSPDGSTTLVMPDGTVIIYPPEVLTLARQPGVRHGLRAAVRPLAQPGIDTMTLKEARDADPWVTITDEDADNLEGALLEPDDGPVLLVNTEYEQLLTVVAPSFQPGAKWKVRESPHHSWFWVSMDDPGFWARVEAGEVAFKTGDRLLARVWLRQWEGDANELHTERSIVSVLRHIAATRPVQEAMFEDPEPPRPESA